MNSVQPIETKRLILRQWQAADTDILAAISADPKVMKYFPAVQTRLQTEAFVEYIHDHFKQYGYGLYAVVTKGTRSMIGFVGLNSPSFEIPGFIPVGLPIMEIGWRLASDQWGKGYATEAAQMVLKHAYTTFGLDEVISFTADINLPSRRVMEKIGLKHDALDDFDHPKLAKGSPLCRHVLYRLTKSQFHEL